jgi:folate-binding protein YgfZ
MADADVTSGDVRAGLVSALRTGFRLVEASGSDARRWLNDLVTGPVGSLRPGRSTRSLLLTPTGRIRADFTVADAGGLVLLQERSQPAAIDELLAPYVLSSDVELRDVSERMSLFSLPGAEEPPPIASQGPAFSPSVSGPGVDLLVEREAEPEIAAALADPFPRVAEDALERWRIRLGSPRMGVDFHEGALPAEAGLESAIDLTKGCFLGQESVAKVRNLGHPATVIVALRATEPVASGALVRSGTEDVGEVTSSAISPDGTALLAALRWEARRAALRSVSGAHLTPIEGRNALSES